MHTAYSINLIIIGIWYTYPVTCHAKNMRRNSVPLSLLHLVLHALLATPATTLKNITESCR